MALLHTCRRVLQLIEQKSSLHLCRNIQQSAVLAKKSTSGKKSKDNKLSEDREEKDKLLDAAADVAASMQHIGDEVFDDLAAQIGKMDSGPSDSSSQSASQSSTKGLSADQTKKRIDQILHKYKALSKQSVKSSRKSPGKVTSAEDKPPIDEKTSQSERSTPAAEENLPVFSQTAFLDKIIANKGNLQSDALKSNKKSRKGRKGSSSESTASNKVSGDLDGPRMAASFKTQQRAKARTTKTQPVDLDLDMDDVPLENIQG
ncbi:hypothetical protein EB796_019799 [Bugula neritina]|uniref:Uncharacterized protein n=1 Tax=Bugula neritina TaxID=10212 RepID=A0A7J7J6W2_BUGNE|nr:hypothetical protein EB796_019799 [Bugula neritina]